MRDLISRRGQPRRLFFLLLGLLAATATPAQDDFLQCSEIEDDRWRLECYDLLARTIREGKRPTLIEEAPPPPEELILTVVAVGRTAYGKLILELDNGETWQQLDSARLNVESGEAVRIMPARAGSFLLEKTSGSRQIRVKPVSGP